MTATDSSKATASKGRNLTLKALILGGMAFFLVVASFLLLGLVWERKETRNQAVNEVHAMWAGEQVLGTPLLSVPFVGACDSAKNCHEEWLHLRPETFDGKANLRSEVRQRGIFEVPQYQGDMAMDFRFAQPNWQELGLRAEQLDWSRAELSLSVADPRGLNEAPVLSSGGQQWRLKALSGGSGRLGVQVPSAESWLSGAALHIGLALRGSESFGVEAVAGAASVQLKSDWSSPGFSGEFLPAQRVVNEQGFDAIWKVMAVNHGQALTWIGERPSLPRLAQPSRTSYEVESDRNNTGVVGFRQVLPIDNYAMTERAVKYAVLFIVLTFVLGFFAEALTGRSIHPLQYLLVGASLLVFYVLLLSLSEQVAFAWAYGLATLAVMGQISWFVAKVMAHRGATLSTVGLLGVLYGGLFVLLRMEDLALLAGSIALFLILGVLMYLSTKIQWGDRNVEGA